jgi:Domain of Unknown Function (DUF1259)
MACTRAGVTRTVAIAAMVAVVMAGCDSGSKDGGGSVDQAGNPRSPRTTTDAVEGGYVLPAAALNLTTGINFQPVGGGRAAINGDFLLTAPEVQKVIQALRAGNIQIVESHNHDLTEQPRLFYMHFWAVDDAVTLARALRPALDATNLQSA